MILARFRDLSALRAAAARVAAEPGMRLEVYTPFEPFDDDDPAAKTSWIPLAILIAGLVGAIGFFVLQSYAQVAAYPMNIGGRPGFSWPPYVPNAIEVGILLAVVAGFVCFFVAAGMPLLYHAVDRFDAAREGTRDAFLLLAESDHPAQLRALIESLHPLRIEEMA